MSLCERDTRRLSEILSRCSVPPLGNLIYRYITVVYSGSFTQQPPSSASRVASKTSCTFRPS